MQTTTTALESMPEKVIGRDPIRRQRWIRAIAMLVLSCAALSFASVSVHAQEIPGLSLGEAEVPVVDPTTAEEIAERRAAVKVELAQVSGPANEGSTTETGHREAVRSRLLKIEALLGQQAALTTPASLTEDGSRAALDLGASAYALNVLYEAQWSINREESNRNAQLAVSRETLATAKQKFEGAERIRREARSALEDASAQARDTLQQTLTLRQLDSRIAQEEVHLRTLETRAVRRGGDGTGADTDLDERIQAMRKELTRAPGTANTALEVLSQREVEIQRAREIAVRRHTTANLRLEAAVNRLAKSIDPPADAYEEIDALTARRDAIHQEVELAESQLARIDERRAILQQWEALLRGGVPREDTPAREATATEKILALKQAGLQHEWRATDLQHRLDAIEGRLAELPAGSQVHRAIEEQREALGRLLRSELAEVAALEADLRLTQRYHDDLKGGLGQLEPLEYLVQGLVAIRDFWTYEITTVDDAPVSVGSLVVAISLFSIGFWASRKGSGFVGRVSEQKLKVDPGAAHAFETLSFYAFFVGFGLLALRMVHFPLTAFTVLGGALAIGIGFGSQNVMNNFISGLILMLERPVRARDVVEVDGNHGIIEQIGARSTRIRSTDGRQIIVPNSFFLESNVVNWTLSDEMIRAQVTVGVIYGSPTRLVEELIGRVVEEEERVIKSPAPVIIFDEFGDNSLNFDVYFWVKARSPMDTRKVQSRVRFAIDDLFREHNLVIAFPQRDVHLDTSTPLEVRMVDAGDPKEGEPTPSGTRK